MGYGVEEVAECGAVLGEDFDELDAIADLRVAGDDFAEDEKGVGDLQFEFEAGTDWERVHAFDVAAAGADVGGGAADRSFVAIGVNFDRYSRRESRVLTPFGNPSIRNHGPTSVEPQDPLCEV